MSDPDYYIHFCRKSVHLYVHEKFVIWESFDDVITMKLEKLVASGIKEFLSYWSLLENTTCHKTAVVNQCHDDQKLSNLINKAIIPGNIILAVVIGILLKDWMNSLFLPSEFLKMNSLLIYKVAITTTG